MKQLTKKQLDALAQEIETIVRGHAKNGGDYAKEFAVYTAGYIASLVSSPDPNGSKRLIAQARAVAETIEEIGDQALDAILAEVEAGLRFLIAVGKAAL